MSFFGSWDWDFSIQQIDKTTLGRENHFIQKNAFMAFVDVADTSTLRRIEKSIEIWKLRKGNSNFF